MMRNTFSQNSGTCGPLTGWAAIAVGATLATATIPLAKAQSEPKPAASTPTPQEQRRQQRERERLRTGQALIETQRMSLALHGITAKELQDTIIAFSVERAIAREELHTRRLKLHNGLRNRLPAGEQATLLKEYREAARKAELDDEKALLALDSKIGYSRNPHLESSLVLAGVLGEEKATLEGPLGLGAFGAGYFAPATPTSATPTSATPPAPSR